MRRLWRKRRAVRETVGQVLPPEGVPPLHLPVAGLGVRMGGAQIADLLITIAAAVAFVVLLASAGLTDPPQTFIAIISLIFFLIRVPYYVLSELIWNGQTLGKRMLKIKVISHHGGSLTAHALVLRNLMKEAEIFLPATLLIGLQTLSPMAAWLAVAWISIGLSIPLLDPPYRRRLGGDLVSGTHVIHLPVPILLRDLAQARPTRRLSAGIEKDGFTFYAHQLDHYGGAFELQTLEKLLRAQEVSGAASRQQNQRATIEAVVEKIRVKIGYGDPVPRTDRMDFLRAFYNAQREHLEQHQLFGERRKDKHYAAPPDAEE